LVQALPSGHWLRRVVPELAPKDGLAEVADRFGRVLGLSSLAATEPSQAEEPQEVLKSHDDQDIRWSGRRAGPEILGG
jgi:hypothetical protein